jgi:hypothetical protein
MKSYEIMPAGMAGTAKEPKPYEIPPGAGTAAQGLVGWTKGAVAVAQGMPMYGASGARAFGRQYDPAGAVPTQRGKSVPEMGRQPKSYEMMPDAGVASQGLGRDAKQPKAHEILPDTGAATQGLGGKSSGCGGKSGGCGCGGKCGVGGGCGCGSLHGTKALSLGALPPMMGLIPGGVASDANPASWTSPEGVQGPILRSRNEQLPVYSPRVSPEMLDSALFDDITDIYNTTSIYDTIIAPELRRLNTCRVLREMWQSLLGSYESVLQARDGLYTQLSRLQEYARTNEFLAGAGENRACRELRLAGEALNGLGGRIGDPNSHGGRVTELQLAVARSLNHSSEGAGPALIRLSSECQRENSGSWEDNFVEAANAIINSLSSNCRSLRAAVIEIYRWVSSYKHLQSISRCGIDHLDLFNNRPRFVDCVYL